MKQTKRKKSPVDRKQDLKSALLRKEKLFRRINDIKMTLLQYKKRIPEYEGTLAYLKDSIPKLEKELHGKELAYNTQAGITGDKAFLLTKTVKRDRIIKQIRKLEKLMYTMEDE